MYQFIILYISFQIHLSIPKINMNSDSKSEEDGRSLGDFDWVDSLRQFVGSKP